MNRCSRSTRRRPDFSRRSRCGEFIQTIAKQLPAADIVPDRFHASKYLNESVDKARRQEHKELLLPFSLLGVVQIWFTAFLHFYRSDAKACFGCGGSFLDQLTEDSGGRRQGGGDGESR